MVLRLNKGRQKTYCVVFACGRQENHHEDDLEPIPHPDTVLLDWASNPENGYCNIMLPKECVEANLYDARSAMKMVMELQREDFKNGIKAALGEPQQEA